MQSNSAGFVRTAVTMISIILLLIYESIFCQSQWTAHDIVPQGSSYLSMAYGDSIYVGVWGSGTIVTSSDGINWISRASGITKGAGLYSVVFGNDLFVAVGGFGLVVTSSNGIDWESQVAKSSALFATVAFGNGVYVIVGSNGTIMTSQNGVDWTKEKSGTEAFLNGVGYGNNQFVVVGDILNSNAAILTSPNGKSWISQNSGTPITLWHMAYGNNVFVVLSTDEFRTVSGGAMALNSSDGIVWTRKKVDYFFQSITFGNGQFVAVGDSGRIFTSPDGSIWTKQSIPTTRNLYSVTFGKDQFIAIGDGISVISPVDQSSGPIRHPVQSSFKRSGLRVYYGKGTVKFAIPGITGGCNTSALFFSGLGKRLFLPYDLGADGLITISTANLPTGIYLSTIAHVRQKVRITFIIDR